MYKTLLSDSLLSDLYWSNFFLWMCFTVWLLEGVLRFKAVASHINNLHSVYYGLECAEKHHNK